MSDQKAVDAVLRADEQLNGEDFTRLDLMASGDDQWDLSRNDMAAIRRALKLISALKTALVAARVELQNKESSQPIHRVASVLKPGRLISPTPEAP